MQPEGAGLERSIELGTPIRSISVSKQSPQPNYLSHQLMVAPKLLLLHPLITPKNYLVDFCYEVSGFWDAHKLFDESTGPNWPCKTEYTKVYAVWHDVWGRRPLKPPDYGDSFATSYVFHNHETTKPSKPPDYYHNSIVMRPLHVADHLFVYRNQKEKLISTWQLRRKAEVHTVWVRTEFEYHMFMFDGISLFLGQNYEGGYKSWIQSISNGFKRDSGMKYVAMVLAIRTEGKKVINELIKSGGVPALVCTSYTDLKKGLHIHIQERKAPHMMFFNERGLGKFTSTGRVNIVKVGQEEDNLMKIHGLNLFTKLTSPQGKFSIVHLGERGCANRIHITSVDPLTFGYGIVSTFIKNLGRKNPHRTKEMVNKLPTMIMKVLSGVSKGITDDYVAKADYLDPKVIDTSKTGVKKLINIIYDYVEWSSNGNNHNTDMMVVSLDLKAELKELNHGAITNVGCQAKTRRGKTKTCVNDIATDYKHC